MGGPVREESRAGGIPCGRNPVREQFRGEESRGEGSHAGGIPCGRNPVGRDPVGRDPVREESRVGGVPWEGSRVGGILLVSSQCTYAESSSWAKPGATTYWRVLNT